MKNMLKPLILKSWFILTLACMNMPLSGDECDQENETESCCDACACGEECTCQAPCYETDDVSEAGFVNVPVEGRNYDYRWLDDDDIDFIPIFDWNVSYRMAYYRPSSKIARKIYSSAWIDYEMEVEGNVYDNWNIWGSVNWSSKRGNSFELKHQTRVSVTPITFGAKYYFSAFPCLDLYLGAGICYSILHIKDHSEFVKKHTTGETVGGVFKSGFHYDFETWEFFIDGFADYIYQVFDFSHGRKHVKRRQADLSGVKVGGGFGMYF